jgi:hypothetical protein
VEALKARRDHDSIAKSSFRAFSADEIFSILTQGVALGYHLSRRWRWNTIRQALEDLSPAFAGSGIMICQ